VMDPGPSVIRLLTIDTALPLRTRLLAAVTVLQERLADVMALMDALHLFEPPPVTDHGRGGEPLRVAHAEMLVALRRLLEPDRARLRMSPEEVARRIRLVTFAATHPRITDNHPMTPEEIVDLLLDGVCLGPRPDLDPHVTHVTDEPGDLAC
jgi:hypothetical protein